MSLLLGSKSIVITFYHKRYNFIYSCLFYENITENKEGGGERQGKETRRNREKISSYFLPVFFVVLFVLRIVNKYTEWE